MPGANEWRVHARPSHSREQRRPALVDFFGHGNGRSPGRRNVGNGYVSQLRTERAAFVSAMSAEWLLHDSIRTGLAERCLVAKRGAIGCSRLALTFR